MEKFKSRLTITDSTLSARKTLKEFEVTLPVIDLWNTHTRRCKGISRNASGPIYANQLFYAVAGTPEVRVRLVRLRNCFWLILLVEALSKLTLGIGWALGCPDGVVP